MERSHCSGCRVDLMIPLRDGFGTLRKQVAGRLQGHSLAPLFMIMFTIKNYLFISESQYQSSKIIKAGKLCSQGCIKGFCVSGKLDISRAIHLDSLCDSGQRNTAFPIGDAGARGCLHFLVGQVGCDR